MSRRHSVSSSRSSSSWGPLVVPFFSAIGLSLSGCELPAAQSAALADALSGQGASDERAGHESKSHASCGSEHESEHERESGHEHEHEEHCESRASCTASPRPCGVGSPALSSCFSESFVQPHQPRVNSVDLLFVVDTSGSMSEERERMAESVDSFVRRLPSGMDLRMGVMPAHGSLSPWSGRLYAAGGVGPVLKVSTLGLDLARHRLKALLSSAPADRSSDGGEEGLYALQAGLSAARLAALRAQGFFREDAALVVVFIADENDICAVYPQGVVPVADPDRLEALARSRDCRGVSVDSVLARVREVQAGRPWALGGIVYSDPRTLPHRGENELGYGYLELIQASGGVVVDLARAQYERGLDQIGELLVQKLDLKTEFKPANAGLLSETLEVRIDGRIVESSWDSVAGIVRVESSGRAGSEVAIRYCVAPAPAPTPIPTPTPTVTPSPSATPVDPVPTPSPSATPVDPVPTPSPSATPVDPVPTPSPSASPVDPAPTPSPSVTPVDPVPTPSPSATPVDPAPTPTPSVTPSPSASPVDPCGGLPSCGGPGGFLGV